MLPFPYLPGCFQIRVYPRSSAAKIYSGAEGEIRTLEASLEDSNVSSYITPASQCRFPIADYRLPIGAVRLKQRLRHL